MENFSLKTKASFRRSSRRERVLRIAGVTIVLFVLLFFFGNLIGKAVAIVVTPLYSVTTWFRESAAPLPSYLRSRGELLSEINVLRTELASLSGAAATIEHLSAEHARYESTFGIAEDKRVGAGVIARPPFLPYDAFIIDRGADDGIAEGAIVYHAKDQAIGYVRKAFKTSSLVTLFSSPGTKATAYLFGPNVYVNLYGEGGGVMRLSVPQGIDVKKGDVVVLPGLKRGILGLVDELRSVPTEPEQQAFVTFSAPLQSLSFVTISTRAIEPLSYEDAEALIRDFEYGALKIDTPDTTQVPVTEYSTSTVSTSTQMSP